MDMRLEQIGTGVPVKLRNQHNSGTVDAKLNHEQTNEDKKFSLGMTKNNIKTAVTKLNEFIEPLRTDLQFTYHEKLGEYYVKVINPLTKEVIKEIPPKKMLDMYADMAEFMGILIDEKI
ncbi:flagellar protein FlaG [Cerasibacillus sp. JNUCC 74]|jgi:flagellar protein FlaG|uniref:flagellar protein FlaG n=1 Tax=Virgibacillus proomii TaxID=84407 RepID=UPI001FEA5ED5|nr:flagellar protein FlaG [Virgibacillus proomii]